MSLGVESCEFRRDSYKEGGGKAWAVVRMNGLNKWGQSWRMKS